MDRPLDQHKHNFKKLITYIGVFAMVFLLVSAVVWSRNVTQTIAVEDISTARATYGDFQEIIVVSGIIEPSKSMLVDVQEGGTITEILAEDGQEVKAGQVLIKLNNQSVTIDFMQRETQMVEQINNLRNTRINLYTNQRNSEDQLLQAENDLKQFQRKFTTDSSLFTDGVIAEQEYMNSADRLDLIRKKTAILRNRKAEDLQTLSVQINRIDESISLMERNLEELRSTSGNLEITAPMSGQLNSFDFEPGEKIMANQNAGRVDDLSEYIVKATVDQHYINRISTGLSANIGGGSGHFHLQVSKVLPTISNGQFEIYLSFNDSIPQNIRRGQIFQVSIEVSAKKKSVMIPKGMYFNSSGGRYVFILNEDQKIASKREIRLGSQNQESYEVLEGIEEGERFISSSYEDFKEREEIKIE